MAPLAVILSDQVHEGHLLFDTFLTFISPEM